MTSASFLKSKAFKEREENARDKVRQASKQDLLADISRLYGDAAFSDVSFTVCNSEFQAHTVVLRARAPNFCWHFLPRHSSPVSVQTSIQINGLEATAFETFLRSAYTEDDFKDYNESSYPWKRQKTSCLADELNHVVCETELKCNDNASFQNDVPDAINGIIQPGHAVDGTTIATPVNATESCGDDVTYTQSQCGNMESNNTSKIAARGTNDMLGNAKKAEPLQQNNDEHFETQSVSSCLCDDVVNNTEHASQESSPHHVVTTSNTTQENETLLVANQPQDQAGQNNVNLVTGFHPGVLEKGTGSVSPQRGCDTCTPLPRHFFNGEAEGVEENIAYKLTLTDAKIVANSFKPKQRTELDLTVNHTAPEKPSESELESCCCKLGQDLLGLFTSGAGYDVIFLVNGGKVKAHKAILCARSNYFSAMLYGDWVEGRTNEIPLIGVNYNGFMTILKYLYGGITQVKSDMSLICDTLPLVDMYGLEGLREIIICTLKIEKCHMFHKPCAECLAGVPECLEVSELFGLADLRKSCIKWMAKYFDRVLGSKGFATLPKKLQEEVLAEIQRSFVISSAIEVLNHCDKLSSCTPLVKWTEPVHVAVSAVQESCLLFVSNNFFSLLRERSFHEILKGVGWSVPVLEKILAAVKRNLTIENCCGQLKAILKLKNIIKLKIQEEGEECYPEEVVDLVVHLHKDCVKFARSNLFKVTRSEGWKRLQYVTQREIKEGAVFSGLGDSGDLRNTKQRSAPPSAQQNSSRPPTRSALQRVGTESRSRGLVRGNATVDGQLNRSSERPSSTRHLQGRADPASTNKRPSLSQPTSAQESVMLGSGKMPSTSKGAAEKKPLTTCVARTSGSSRVSAQTSSASVRGKALLSNVHEHSTRRSCQPTGKFQPVTSAKDRSLLAQENSTGRPSSAPSPCGVIKKAPSNSRPALLSGNDKRFTREKPVTMEGSRVQAKHVQAGAKTASVSSSRQSRPKQSKAPLASCDLNKASTSTDCKEKTSKKELFKNGNEGLKSTTEHKMDLVSSLEEKSQAIENYSGSTYEQVETLEGENESNSQGGAQANSPGTVNNQDASVLLNEAVDEGCSQSQCHDSPSKLSDSLELD